MLELFSAMRNAFAIGFGGYLAFSLIGAGIRKALAIIKIT